ncbi:putative beta-lysine N-acetyltransferase [Robertmurraya kyonggiensis]|uniref:putative beta-lysine N-acetyltransferase n=1 Tax=Robertmurraya kyonggiensis TaxID=1037680 RepID=UPI00187FDBF8|nr:putative beta-lysine N-acetyltransferase [Robertmurraya kyonggiensis]
MKSFIDEKNYFIEVYNDPFNKRIRIDDLRGNLQEAIHKAEELAVHSQVEKLIIKGRREQYIALLEKGFQCEAMIDDYFLGSDGYFFCKYFTAERRNSEYILKENEIVKNVQDLPQNSGSISPPKEYELMLVSEAEALMLARLYKQVFEVYPAPLHDPEYIKKTMADGTIYYAFTYGDEIVSAASAEISFVYKNAELTDCATLPEHRKFGLMKILLEKLEEQLKAKGIFCSYSIARGLSFGMNAALHQLCYRYRGRLINNCYIFDKIEDMNVWVKNLAE